MDKIDRQTALLISRFSKEKFLLTLSEEQFRDNVVRPLLLSQKMEDGRDLCGTSEKGKDSLFLDYDALGIRNLYVVQTKKGSLNLSRKVQSNIVEAITQLKTALSTPYQFLSNRQKIYPTKAILCASGKINDIARNHISNEVKDPRLVFLDSDDIIPMIDKYYPEYWLGINAELIPYLRELKFILERPKSRISFSEIIQDDIEVGTATDSLFVQLQVYRSFLKSIKQKGKIIQKLNFEEFPVTGLIGRKETKILLLGEAGSGKSTALKRIAYILASRGLMSDSNIKIPVLLRAIDIHNNNNSYLLDLINIETMGISKQSQPCFSVEDLEKGNLIVLIDALDEISDESAKKFVLFIIDDFLRKYPNSKVIMTARDIPTILNLSELHSYLSYRLSPINYKQAEQIIKRIQTVKQLSEEQSEEILRRIQDVHGMCLNPLLVTVFAATSEYSRKDIPANITELFKKFTELMLGRWDATKGLSQQFQAPLKDFILKKIAFEMHRRRVTYLNIQDFENIVNIELSKRGYKPDIKQLLKEITERSGLFIISGNKIEFRHLLLQEFFAGRGIPSSDLIDTYISDDWWQRAIVFYFGENPGDTKALESIITKIAARPINEIYVAALAIGLALQACYLAEVKEKYSLLKWVIEILSNSKEPYLEAMKEVNKYPFLSFIHYYLFSRDSVACAILEDKAQELIDSWAKSDLNKFARETRVFWTIVGLLESGLLDTAEAIIRDFKPHDRRLLLAIYMSCFIIQHLRVTNKDNKIIAERICKRLVQHIHEFRIQLLEEFKSELLEIRKGQIKSLELHQ